MTSGGAAGAPPPGQTDATAGADLRLGADKPAAGFLSDPDLRLIMFGGKGGVGKTTIAAATALHWAHHLAGDVLVISTDPAHSLSDAFDQTVDDQITAVDGEPGLFAQAVDASARLDAFKERYGGTIGTIVERGTYLDDEDVREFLELSLPGLDELMAVIEIAALVRAGRYALVILDTAPTGHTLRLLAMPELMRAWLRVLDLMLEKHRYIQSVFGHRQRDETDVFMERMAADLESLRALLRDPRTTRFVPVTVPEAMSVAETRRLVESLSDLGVPVRAALVNRVAREADEADCAFCARRWLEQQHWLHETAAQFGAGKDSPGVKAPRRETAALGVPLLPRQVHGRARLHELAELLRRAESIAAGDTRAATATPGRAPATSPAPDAPEHPEERIRARMALERAFVLVAGKGGVGKTTIAAATAIHLARRRETLAGGTRGRRVLLLSADPAHSLADCLGQDLGDDVTEVEGVPGLDALELRAATMLSEVAALYSAEAREAFSALGAGGDLDVAFDGGVMNELMSLTPPGLDELMTLMKTMDLVHADRYDALVLDLAPTGHALRLLETPGLVRSWFMAVFRILLKYQNVVSLPRAGELMRQKSKQLRRVQQLLSDAGRCELVAVTTPEAMAVQETRRLLSGLERVPVRCGWVVANMVAAPSSCAFCATVHDEQRRYLHEIEALGPACLHVPAFATAPRGVAALENVARLICD